MKRSAIIPLLFWGAAFLAASFSYAGQHETRPLTDEAASAKVLFLGEQHDNRGHHALQVAWVTDLNPTAIVFEMLTPAQAMQATADARVSQEKLEEALGWRASGWPDFAMYFPIFAAAPDAEIVGAGVPRDDVHALMNEDLKEVVGLQTVKRFALDQPLPISQQEDREDLQRAAHCNALPEDLLPRMVSIQRLRDAALAQAALDALERLGPPVAVITGNGHARQDWGAPFLLRQAAPSVTVFSLGQGEDGERPQGAFSSVIDGLAVDRGDPCEAFR